MYDEVLIIGSGNQGLSLAYDLSVSGVKINLWNRSFNSIAKLLTTKTVYSVDDSSQKAILNRVSNDINEVLTDFIIVSVPNSAYDDIARMLSKVVNENTVILLSPGRTFGALFFIDSLKKYGLSHTPHIFELQTIIHTARKVSDDTVNIYARKNDVLISSLFSSDAILLKKFPNFLVKHLKYVDSLVYTSLGNMGMLLHCAPTLMNVGCIESERVSFKYYFDGISPTIASFIEKMDNERLEVANKFGFKLESLLEWVNRTYGVDRKNLYESLQNNRSYREIDAPETVHHRYIFEDVPCGLVPVESIASLLGMTTPYITLIIDLACKLLQTDFRAIGRRFDETIIPFLLIKQ